MVELIYTYYPGCSLGATGKAYDISTRAICAHLGIRLEELPDWNCCGATAYFSVDDAASFAVAARNLAIAEKIGYDLITPCSACYITLAKTNYYFREYPEIRGRIQRALSAAGLEYNGTIEARHLLYMFVEDFGMERLRESIEGKGVSLDVAPYYGCQIVRPFTDKESPDIPESMDRLIEVCGSRVVDYVGHRREGGTGIDPLPRRMRCQEQCGLPDHSVPSVPDKPRCIPVQGQQGIRNRFPYSRPVFHPVDRAGSRNGREEARIGDGCRELHIRGGSDLT
jgi:heterodisulfide reductase subunit B